MAERDSANGGPTAETHGDRLWEILDDYECWPGRRLVDHDGEEAAWIIAQRAVFDPGLQRRCLEMLEMAVDAGVPIALSSDAHVPDQLGFRYDDALAALAEAGVTEICVFEGRRRRMEPVG